MRLGNWLQSHDPRRLRILLAGLFVALALPTVVLIQHAFAQLKWESYYQHRLQAEDVSARIDAVLAQGLSLAESRAVADYAFVSAVSNNVVQRSPLSAYPVQQDIPGIIGYFQVSPDGRFSSPLLPGPEIVESGIVDDELGARRDLAAQIENVLAENQLVRHDQTAGRRAQTRELAEELTDFTESAEPAAPRESLAEEAEASPVDFDLGGQAELAAVDEVVGLTEPVEQRYDQVVFDQLNRRAAVIAENAEQPAATDQVRQEARAKLSPAPQRIARVEDLNLDDSLQKLDMERKREGSRTIDESAEAGNADDFRADRPRSAAPAVSVAPKAEADRFGEDNARVVITAFQAEIEPFEFSMLDSGHFVVFRRVWQNNERFIQGALIDPLAFINATIETAFRASALSDMSDLVVAYEDDIIQVVAGRQDSSYPSVVEQPDGALLFRSRLGAPLDSLELVFSINRLPPGPGATILGWTTFVIALVFVGGFFALYRLGLGQIRLARQQQDFVSAVSHELKTPLTSIRMYGEMLKEGWVDEEKRKQYYDYIHDESERLTRLISNVLQLANISRSQATIAMKPTQVGALLDQVRSKIENQVERAGFRIDIDVKPDALDTRLKIDTDCFLQIVINLVDNAIKFSRNAENKAIEISTRLSSDGYVEFCVRDYGPGIPKNQIRKIFRLFYRTESELTRETVGTGIGLAIVHQLTTAMNGNIDVQNMQPGTAFRLKFPVESNSTLSGA